MDKSEPTSAKAAMTKEERLAVRSERAAQRTVNAQKLAERKAERAALRPKKAPAKPKVGKERAVKAKRAKSASVKAARAKPAASVARVSSAQTIRPTLPPQRISVPISKRIYQSLRHFAVVQALKRIWLRWR